jgi:hypothetical protein
MVNFAQFYRGIDDKVAELRMTIDERSADFQRRADGPDGILVTFSDGTIAGYVAEELIALRPIRERVKFFPSASQPD